MGVIVIPPPVRPVTENLVPCLKLSMMRVAEVGQQQRVLVTLTKETQLLAHTDNLEPYLKFPVMRVAEVGQQQRVPVTLSC